MQNPQDPLNSSPQEAGLITLFSQTLHGLVPPGLGWQEEVCKDNSRDTSLGGLEQSWPSCCLFLGQHSPCTAGLQVGVQGLPSGRVAPATGEKVSPKLSAEGLSPSPSLFGLRSECVSGVHCTIWGLELSYFRAGRNLMEFNSALYYAVLNCSLIVSRLYN